MTTNPNDIAFPAIDPTLAAGTSGQGLTKREYFAGQVLQGMFSNQKESFDQDIIRGAVEVADIFIRELNKESK